MFDVAVLDAYSRLRERYPERVIDFFDECDLELFEDLCKFSSAKEISVRDLLLSLGFTFGIKIEKEETNEVIEEVNSFEELHSFFKSEKLELSRKRGRLLLKEKIELVSNELSELYPDGIVIDLIRRDHNLYQYIAYAKKESGSKESMKDFIESLKHRSGIQFQYVRQENRKIGDHATFLKSLFGNGSVRIRDLRKKDFRFYTNILRKAKKKNMDIESYIRFLGLQVSAS